MSKSKTAAASRLKETLRTQPSTESVVMNYRWKPDLHQTVSLRKGTGQPVRQWKRQDLFLLQCEKLQEQQVTGIRIQKRYPESNRKNCPCHKQKGDSRKETPKITSCWVATCHLTANRPHQQMLGTDLKKWACCECISPTCSSWDLSLSSFVNVVQFVVPTQSHFRSQ